MSSKGAEKKKTPRDESGRAVVPPAAKRQKTNATDGTQPPFLLQIRPEILRNVYSFLMLKEALVLRRTHRQFNDAANDIFQYSRIMHWNLRDHGFSSTDEDTYMTKQDQALCNISNENIHAVFRSETVTCGFVYCFMNNLVKYSTTDNAQAASILLEDGRCEVNADTCEAMLKKGFTAMAAVIQEDDRVKEGIKMCSTCDNKVGCHYCANKFVCVNIEQEPKLRYCRECVMSDNRFCKECEFYLCPDCNDEGLFDSCEECHGIICKAYDCRSTLQCACCDRVKCDSCASDGGENWRGPGGGTRCPTCAASMN